MDEFKIGDIVFEKTDTQNKRPMIIIDWGRKNFSPTNDEMDDYWDEDHEKVKCEWTTSYGKKENRVFPVSALTKATST